MTKCRLKEIREPVHKAAGSEFKPLDFQCFVSQLVAKERIPCRNTKKRSQGRYRLKKPLPTWRSGQMGDSILSLLLQSTGVFPVLTTYKAFGLFWNVSTSQCMSFCFLFISIFISLKAQHSYSWQKQPRFAMDAEAANNNPEPLFTMNFSPIHTFLRWNLIYKSCKIIRD